MPQLKLPIFDVGLEWEFLTTITGSGVPPAVQNASKLAERRLGFSIDQNNHAAGQLRLGDDLTLRTDGTAFEAQWFNGCNQGQIISWERVQTKLSNLELLKGLYRETLDYAKAGETRDIWNRPFTFVEPGNAYSSRKELINAYTNVARYSEKKEEPRAVTERTAGFHLHFSVSTHSNNSAALQKELREFLFTRGGNVPDGNFNTAATSELVKLADAVYQELYGPNSGRMSENSKKRVARFQTLGDYRIRRHGTEGGQPTLEYRQLGMTMYGHRTQEFINTFQYEALRYLRAELAE